MDELSPALLSAEDEPVNVLRPRTMADFIGQGAVTSNLLVYIRAARERGEPLDHTLLSGPPGLGKTSLAHIIAAEIGCGITVTSGPALERPVDLAGILTKLSRGDILFIDEIHRTRTVIEEFLYPAMEDFVLDIVIDKGPGARSITINLEPFTLIGSTTREGLLSAPLRSRFSIIEKLEAYPPGELKTIILRSAVILGIRIDDEAAAALAERSRGTPRIANRLLKRLRDFAQVGGKNSIGPEAIETGLDRLGIDREGLGRTDRRILDVLRSHGGGPVGLKTIAVAIGEEEDTIEEVYEPFLIQKNLIRRTPRGRELGPSARGGPPPLFGTLP